MNSRLPDILQRYFKAQNDHDIDALVACFAPDAVVRDEGRDIAGEDAIRAWKLETSAKYHISIEPLESHLEEGGADVVARVSGTFDGSPADLTYRFAFSDAGRIKALDVI